VVYDGSSLQTSVKILWLIYMISPFNVVSQSSRLLHNQPTKREFLAVLVGEVVNLYVIFLQQLNVLC
jgi:hypothetical protein